MTELSDLCEENYPALEKLVSQRQMIYARRRGLGMSEARKRAAQEVAASLVPPTTGSELESFLAKTRCKLYPSSGNSSRRRLGDVMPDLNGEPGAVLLSPWRITTYADDRKNGQKQSMYSLISRWGHVNGKLPSDPCIMYFAGVNYATLQSAKTDMRKHGYTVELQEDGTCLVTPPAPPPSPTELSPVAEDVPSAVQQPLGIGQYSQDEIAAVVAAVLAHMRKPA
jgi:hypothetical protein